MKAISSVIDRITGRKKNKFSRSAIARELDSRPAEDVLQSRLAGDALGLAALERLMQSQRQALRQGQLWDHCVKYNAAMAGILGKECPSPTYFLHVSWQHGSRYGDLANIKLADVFRDVERDLIGELAAKKVPGAIVEFGVFTGHMLGMLLEKAEAIGLKRKFYGFDSFEGLSAPSKEHDYPEWKEGDYAASYESVAKKLKLNQRPHLKLIKGWLEDSLLSPEAQAIKEVAYARIDVDIYEPTRDALAFLTHRLADGAILAFDDWAYTCDKGESKAFIDWARQSPHLRFEWIGQCSSRFYLRVRHVSSA